MVDIAGLYFVITDGSRARFVRSGPDCRLHTIQAVDYLSVRRFDTPSEERGSGRAVGFVGLLAERICADFAVDLFCHLVLVALPPVLAELSALIDEPTAACLIGSLALDLIDTPDEALSPHFRAWFSPCTK